MEKKEIIGIDVSKATLDVFILSQCYHFKVDNSASGFKKLCNVVNKKLNCQHDQQYYCFEDTGKYSLPLCVFFNGQSYNFILLSSLDIKRSMGIVRGKNDKKDAQMIAKYAWQRRDELVPSKLPAIEIIQVKQLCSLRTKLIKH